MPKESNLTFVTFCFCYIVCDLRAACRPGHSLQRQLDTLASLKLNTAELHQSKISLSPVNASIVVRCPVILVHFEKQFSTSGSYHRSKMKGDNGNKRSDTGDGRSGPDKGRSTVVCPSCGHPCSGSEIFMCRSSFTDIVETRFFNQGFPHLKILVTRPILQYKKPGFLRL